MNRRTIVYLLLFLAQAALWNFCNFSQYVLVVFLPAMIFCLPISTGPVRAMLTAFLSGLAMDFLVTGQLGLTSFALVPAALLRRPVISLLFGAEVFVRGEELSFRRQGWQKFVPAVFLMTIAFLLPYIWADDAGMRPLWFGAAKFAASLAVSGTVSVFIAWLMLQESAERWK